MKAYVRMEESSCPLNSQLLSTSQTLIYSPPHPAVTSNPRVALDPFTILSFPYSPRTWSSTNVVRGKTPVVCFYSPSTLSVSPFQGSLTQTQGWVSIENIQTADEGCPPLATVQNKSLASCTSPLEDLVRQNQTKQNYDLDDGISSERPLRSEISLPSFLISGSTSSYNQSSPCSIPGSILMNLVRSGLAH